MQTDPPKTDWDAYYTKPYKTASITRKITTRFLIQLIHQFVTPKNNKPIHIAELGGGNSSFYKKIQETVAPSCYSVIDNNEIGLKKLSDRVKNKTSLKFYHQDVLTTDLSLNADLTFSIGLIEHFTPADMKKVIKAHFDLLSTNGIAIISFPTPTLLYKITRAMAEKLNLWIFHDERALKPKEVKDILSEHGKILYGKTLWPIILTQHFLVIQKT